MSFISSTGARTPEESSGDALRRTLSEEHDSHRRAHEEDASAEDVHDVLHEQQNNTALRRCGRWDAGARRVRHSPEHVTLER